MKWLAAALAIVLLGVASPVLAWGDLGHGVIALIAYAHLTPAAKAKVDAILASDPDATTPPDIASRASWADKYPGHRDTAAWHFANIELDSPDLDKACFGFPPSPTGQASKGPAQDCVVDKINEFAAELRNPDTAPDERILALNFLLHFVGDIHQPLHAADHNDRGGNCVKLSPSPDGDVTSLHVYWDVTTVNALGRSAPEIAKTLDAEITPAQIQQWSAGDPSAWAMELFQLARNAAYGPLPSLPTCDTPAPIALSPTYQAAADTVAARQLQIAGVRLAYVLNHALDGSAPAP